MRGLDGIIPSEGNKAGSTKNKNYDNQGSSADEAHIELPEGQNQKDYLRRLSENIFELEHDPTEPGNKQNGISAIGVLGSDIHDKLMILEALRQRFPHKLFFTTDLDAVYSHPSKWRQTHNLLVVSAFDLKLSHELQGKIPSFRDSYQTALFLATQMAINEKIKIGDQLHKLMLPRLFEIGRNRAIALPIKKDRELEGGDNNSSSKQECEWSNWSSCKTVHPQVAVTAKMPHWQQALKHGMVIVVLMGSLALVNRTIRKWVVEFVTFAQKQPIPVMKSGIVLFLVYYLISLAGC